MDDGEDFESVLAERDRLRAQVTEFQEAGTRMVEASLTRTVRAFHQRFGHAVAWTPHVPSEATVRFRFRLIVEEFSELFKAGFAPDRRIDQAFEILRSTSHGRYPYERAEVRVDLPELVDAIEDLKYVLEGTHATCGVHAPPIAAAIHAANMAKEPVYTASEDGSRTLDPTSKPTKPATWKAPDVAALLVEQGWKL